MSPKETIWSSVFVRLLAFEVFCQFGMAMVNPIVSSFAVSLGAVVTVAGMIAGLNPLAATLLRPLGGIVLGKMRRRSLLLLAAAVAATSSFICAAFSSLVSLTVSRVVLGAAFVVKSSVVVAFASAVVPRSKVGQGVGAIGLAYTVAYALAPAIGSWVGAVFGYRITYAISACLFFAAVVIAASFEEKKAANDVRNGITNAIDNDQSTTRYPLISRFIYLKTAPFAVVAVFETLIQGTMVSLLILVGTQRGIEGASAFFLLYALVTVLARPATSKLYDKFGLDRIIYPEAILMMLCPLILAFSYSLPMFLLASIFMALGQGGLHPCFQAESVRGVPIKSAALAANTFYMGSDIGMALGPIINGAILQSFGPTVMFLSCSAMGFLLIVAYFIYIKRSLVVEA